MNNNGKRSEWSHRSAAPTTGLCPGGDSEPDKVIFNVYNICILCNYWTSVMKHSARQKKKKKKKKSLLLFLFLCRAEISFFFFFVPGGNLFFFFLCRAEIVSGGRPRGAAHRSYNPGYNVNGSFISYCIQLYLFNNSKFCYLQNPTIKLQSINRTLYSDKNMNSLTHVEYIILEWPFKIWTKMDNPLERYDFSKCSWNSVKSLCCPQKLATVPCHGCTTPHW